MKETEVSSLSQIPEIYLFRPEKFPATLITNYKQEYNHITSTPVTIYNTAILYTNRVMIL